MTDKPSGTVCSVCGAIAASPFHNWPDDPEAHLFRPAPAEQPEQIIADYDRNRMDDGDDPPQRVRDAVAASPAEGPRCPKCGQPTKPMYGDEPPSEWEHHCAPAAPEGAAPPDFDTWYWNDGTTVPLLANIHNFRAIATAYSAHVNARAVGEVAELRNQKAYWSMQSLKEYERAEAAESQLHDAVGFILALNEETILAGFPSGDRNQTLANVRAMKAQLKAAHELLQEWLEFAQRQGLSVMAAKTVAALGTQSLGDQPKKEKTMESTFLKELEQLINRHNQENASNTPDFILAQYLEGCLANFAVAIQQRETWYGRDARPKEAESLGDGEKA